jgi:hypothetical protein
MQHKSCERYAMSCFAYKILPSCIFYLKNFRKFSKVLATFRYFANFPNTLPNLNTSLKSFMPPQPPKSLLTVETLIALLEEQRCTFTD